MLPPTYTCANAMQRSVKGLSRLTAQIQRHNLNLSYYTLSLAYPNISQTVILLGNYDIPQSFSARLQAAKAWVQFPVSHRFGQNYGIDFSLRIYQR